MHMEIQAISLTVKPSKSADNRFKRALESMGMYLYIWVNLVTLIRTMKRGAALVSQYEESTILSIQANIKPAKKGTGAAVTAVLP